MSPSGFLLLQACFGLSIDAFEPGVFAWPVVPASIGEVSIQNLMVGSGSIDVVFRRADGDVAMSTARRDGEIETVVMK